MGENLIRVGLVVRTPHFRGSSVLLYSSLFLPPPWGEKGEGGEISLYVSEKREWRFWPFLSRAVIPVSLSCYHFRIRREGNSSGFGSQHRDKIGLDLLPDALQSGKLLRVAWGRRGGIELTDKDGFSLF